MRTQSVAPRGGGSQRTQAGGTAASAVEEPAAPAQPPIVLYAPDLIEWSLWMTKTKAAECSADAKSRGELVKAIQTADDHLYEGDPDAASTGSRPARLFRGAAVAVLKTLSDQDTLADLRKELPQVTVAIGKLVQANKEAAGALAAVNTARKGVKWNGDGCETFDRYTEGALGRFSASAEKILATRTKLVGEVSALRDRVAELLRDAGEAADDNYFRVASVSLATGKLEEVTLSVKRRAIAFPAADRPDDKLAVTETEAASTTIRVREHQRLVVEFAPGVALARVRYPTYGTATVGDQTVVASRGDDIQKASVVALLNLIPNIGRGPVWPMAQVGVGVGKPYPLLLAGAGLRFSFLDLSVAGGAAWSWVRELQDLKLGDPVTGTADIEKDLAYRLRARPAFYFAVQRSF